MVRPLGRPTDARCKRECGSLTLYITAFSFFPRSFSVFRASKKGRRQKVKVGEIFLSESIEANADEGSSSEILPAAAVSPTFLSDVRAHSSLSSQSWQKGSSTAGITRGAAEESQVAYLAVVTGKGKVSLSGLALNEKRRKKFCRITPVVSPPLLLRRCKSQHEEE